MSEEQGSCYEFVDLEQEDPDDVSDEPTGSCDECSVNVYDGGLLCDQCEYMHRMGRVRWKRGGP